MNLGNLLDSDEGKYKYLKMALDIFTKQSVSDYHVAKIYIQLGKLSSEKKVKAKYFKNAIELYNQTEGFEVDEDLALAYHSLGKLSEQKIERKQYLEKAVEIYDKNKLDTVNKAEAHNDLGVLEKECNNNEAAKTHGIIAYKIYCKLHGAGHHTSKKVAETFAIDP